MDAFTLEFLDVIDILLVATILYQLFRLIRGTAASYIFITVAAIYILWLVVDGLGMKLISMLLGQVIGVGMIALIVVFQQEIRRSLLFVGSKYSHVLAKHFKGAVGGRDDISYIDEIVTACDNMSASQTGALIVFTRKSILSIEISSGDIIRAIPSHRLIEAVFYKNSPMHDGAMIITRGRVEAARCVLPTTDRTNVPANMGLRHRAAIGISEHTDAVVVVVSEQTGRISYVEDGVITTSLSSVVLKQMLVKAL